MKPFGTVHLVGAGPGDPDLLTLRAARLIGQAEVVVHDRLVSREILDLVRPGVRMVPVGKAPGAHSVTQDRINDTLVALAQSGLMVVRLKGGDPLIFGRGSEEAAVLRAAGVPVQSVPGITAAQGTAAATGVPLTHRGLATGVRYVTGHCQRNAPRDLDWHGLADPKTTLVVYMGVAHIAEIARSLICAGMPFDLPVMAVANATTPTERRLVTRLDRVGLEIQRWPKNGPVLCVSGHVVSLLEVTAPGERLPESLVRPATTEPVHV